MAEIVGLAASIIQIASAGAQLSTALYNFVGSAARADHEISDIAGDVEITANALDSVGRVFEDEGSQSVVSKKAIQDAKNLIKRCESVFDEIKELTEKRRRVGKDGKKSLSALGKFSWPLKEQRVQLLRGRLESLKNSLILLFHVLQLANGQAKGKLEKSALQEEREKIRQLHQRQQDSIKALEALESRLGKVCLDDEETLQGSTLSSRVPTLELAKLPSSSPHERSKVDHTGTEFSDEESTLTDASDDSDEEHLTIEEVARCADHVTKLLRKISALQQSFKKTTPSPRLPRKRVRKLYYRFCQKFETDILLQAESSLAILQPLPAFEGPLENPSQPPTPDTVAAVSMDETDPTYGKPGQDTADPTSKLAPVRNFYRPNPSPQMTNPVIRRAQRRKAYPKSPSSPSNGGVKRTLQDYDKDPTAPESTMWTSDVKEQMGVLAENYLGSLLSGSSPGPVPRYWAQLRQQDNQQPPPGMMTSVQQGEEAQSNQGNLPTSNSEGQTPNTAVTYQCHPGFAFGPRIPVELAPPNDWYNLDFDSFLHEDRKEDNFDFDSFGTEPRPMSPPSPPVPSKLRAKQHQGAFGNTQGSLYSRYYSRPMKKQRLDDGDTDPVAKDDETSDPVKSGTNTDIRPESENNDQSHKPTAPNAASVHYAQSDKPQTGSLPHISDGSADDRARPGRRTLFGRLPAEVAKSAHDMRRMVACSPCRQRRLKCDGGSPCNACLKYCRDGLYLSDHTCGGVYVSAFIETREILAAGVRYDSNQPWNQCPSYRLDPAEDVGTDLRQKSPCSSERSTQPHFPTIGSDSSDTPGTFVSQPQRLKFRRGAPQGRGRARPAKPIKERGRPSLPENEEPPSKRRRQNDSRTLPKGVAPPRSEINASDPEEMPNAPVGALSECPGEDEAVGNGSARVDERDIVDLLLEQWTVPVA